MIRTVGDWQKAWIKLNGTTSGFEVIIYHHNDVLYQGSFCDIPGDLLEKGVLRSEQICASSVPERDGAFCFLV